MSSVSDVISFAKVNSGVFTTHEAAALGMSKKVLAKRVEDGVFVRVTQGVYVLPGTATRPDIKLRIACRTMGAVVSHASAARIQGFEPIWEGPPSVTVSHRSTHDIPGLDVFQSTDLIEAHVHESGGLRITIPERTIIDLARNTGVERLQRIVENAVISRRVDWERLNQIHESLARRGKPGVRKLREVLGRYDGPPDAESSELEKILLQLIRSAGLPEPVREFHAPWLKPVNGRVDLAYPPNRLVIEGDSRKWHAKFDAFEEDRVRDNAAQLAGWRVLRFTWRMILEEPHIVIAAIRLSLENEG